MRFFRFKTVSDPTNDNSVSGSNVPRDQLLKVARQTVIFFFSRTRIYSILVTLQNLFRRPLNDIRLLQFCSHAPDESDHILNIHRPWIDPWIVMKRFVFPKEKRGEERRRRKNLSRKKTILSRSPESERERRNRERGTGNRHRLGRFSKRSS